MFKKILKRWTDVLRVTRPLVFCILQQPWRHRPYNSIHTTHTQFNQRALSTHRVKLTCVNVSTGRAVLQKETSPVSFSDLKKGQHDELFRSYLIANESEALSWIVPLILHEGLIMAWVFLLVQSTVKTSHLLWTRATELQKSNRAHVNCYPTPSTISIWQFRKLPMFIW